MFIRKKKNPSGVISVQIIDKSKGKYKVVRTIGSSKDELFIDDLIKKGCQWIEVQSGTPDMFKQKAREEEEKQVTEHLLSNIENVLINGKQLILDKVFKITGFEAIEDDILRQLVIARLGQPMSKSATVDYLKSYFDENGFSKDGRHSQPQVVL